MELTDARITGPCWRRPLRAPGAGAAFLRIAGEHYFAVHHKRLKRHTLHPVALSLKEWEEEKKAAARQSAQEETTQEG